MSKPTKKQRLEATGTVAPPGFHITVDGDALVLPSAAFDLQAHLQSTGCFLADVSGEHKVIVCMHDGKFLIKENGKYEVMWIHIPEPRRKKVKDPNRPKRASSGYQLFVASSMDKAKAAGTKLVFSECGNRWKNLGDKGQQEWNTFAKEQNEQSKA